MKEPEIKIGFIIFNEDWKQELEWSNGHRKTALKWIRDHNMMNLFLSMIGTNKIYDEEDFLIEYIGAIKLYAYNGKYYFRIPRMISDNKSFLKRYYRGLGYQIIGNDVYDEHYKEKVLKYKYPYNKTVISEKGSFAYNPYRNGD